jgi:hypothetical protein
MTLTHSLTHSDVLQILFESCFNTTLDVAFIHQTHPLPKKIKFDVRLDVAFLVDSWPDIFALFSTANRVRAMSLEYSCKGTNNKLKLIKFFKKWGPLCKWL